MSDVTRILAQIESGDAAAVDQLLPLVYNELRSMAAARFAHEKPGQTLQATALVHEVYLRLLAPGTGGSGEPELAYEGGPLTDEGSPVRQPQKWRGRKHFLAAAAEAMRRILVDKARRKAAQKHGGNHARRELVESAAATAPLQEVIAVHDALDALAAEDHLAAELVKMHYFGGFSLEEAAEVLGMSRSSAYRSWTYARAWLAAQLHAEQRSP